MTDVPERAGGDAGVTGDHAGDTAGPVGPTRRRRGGTDRGVSEVIAFVLVFSIVVVSIGLLYTVGFGGISQLQETEQDHSGERAMRAFAVALEDIQADRGSVRQARLELAGRTITVDESSALTVSVGGDSVTAEGAFTYVGGGDTEIAYHSGAVIRSQGPDAQLVQRPPMIRCTDEHAVLSLVNVTQVETGSFSSGGAVDIRAEQVNAREEQVVAQASGSPTVEVDYSSSGYATAWERYFTEQGWDSPSSGSATCEADSVYVRMTEIQLEYIGV